MPPIQFPNFIAVPVGRVADPIGRGRSGRVRRLDVADAATGGLLAATVFLLLRASGVEVGFGAPSGDSRPLVFLLGLAVASMTAVAKHWRPCQTALIVLPLVSAVFVDLANAPVVQGSLHLFAG